MDKLGHETLVDYTSLAEAEGRKVRRLRPRTYIYGGLLVSLALFGFTLLVQRVPFEATVNRAPGSLFTLDADGYVRNTYILMITSNQTGDESVNFQVFVEGLPGAEVLTQDVSLASSETKTLPLIVRIPQGDEMQRTMPMEVRVVSPDGELTLSTTFKSGASFGAGPSSR